MEFNQMTKQVSADVALSIDAVDGALGDFMRGTGCDRTEVVVHLLCALRHWVELAPTALSWSECTFDARKMYKKQCGEIIAEFTGSIARDAMADGIAFESN